MVIKEFPEIKKGKKVIVNKTTTQEIVHDFSTQLQNRGNCCLNYFSNKKEMEEIEGEITPEKVSELCGIKWTEDFDTNDMINVVMNYVTIMLPKKDMLAFATQLQSLIMQEYLEAEEDDSNEGHA